MLLCKFCNKECKNDNSLRNHERLCSSNVDRQIIDRSATSYIIKETPCVYCTKLYTSSVALSNHKVRCKDNPYRIIHVITSEGKERIVASNSRRVWTADQRTNHSVSMRKAVLSNPESYTSNNVCGRIVIEAYKGEKFHGRWELLVAKWLDNNNIKWERKIKPFNYFWNDTWHLYFPDFYLPASDMYIEVKGYERERDRCKWAVVPNLIVLKSKEIKEIQQGIFAL